MVCCSRNLQLISQLAEKKWREGTEVIAHSTALGCCTLAEEVNALHVIIAKFNLSFECLCE